MIDTSIIIEDVKSEFEGGSSLAVNWDNTIRRGMENVIDNCRPETLKRKTPLYCGMVQGVSRYYCPSDVLVPTELHTNSDDRVFSYVPPAQFYKTQDDKTFTIEYINGVRFISAYNEIDVDALVLDSMDELGTKTGADVSLNTYNVISGTASIQAIFTDASETVSDTFAEEKDISDYLQGVIVLPVYIPVIADFDSLRVRLLSSAGNYYEVDTTTISSYLIDGLNVLLLDMKTATTLGTPDATAIISWEITGTAGAGKTTTLVFGSFSIEAQSQHFLEYYSNAPYVHGVSGALWQTSVSNAQDDKVNIDRDVAGILHYEMCLLVVQSSTFDSIDSNASKRFEAQLRRKYEAYNDIHPSSERPLSYNIGADIPVGM